MSILTYIAIAVAAYLIGSISPSLIISKYIMKKDVRQYGSGNAGTTNMVRNFGWKLGVCTFALDILKGAMAGLLGRHFGGELGAAIAIVCAVLGHSYPLYYGFRGGKGVATSMGAMLGLFPLHSLVIYVICFAIVAVTGIVSIGSLCGFLLYTLMVWLVLPGLVGLPLKIAIAILTVLTFIGHRGNIKRLLNGTENKLFAKKNK